MSNHWPPAHELAAKVDSDLLRAEFEDYAKTEWPPRLEVAMAVRGEISDAQLAALADTTRQTIEKVRTGQIVPREYLRYSICIALECDVPALYPYPTRRELLERIAARTGRAAAA